MKPLTTTSEPAKEYAADLSAADTREKLLATLTAWRAYASDALAIATAWSDEDFAEWREALATERARTYMGDERAERFAVVLMPGIMWAISEVALTYDVPFVAARDRMVSIGALKHESGRLVDKRQGAPS